jgi:hypothetical protein
LNWIVIHDLQSTLHAPAYINIAASLALKNTDTIKRQTNKIAVHVKFKSNRRMLAGLTEGSTESYNPFAIGV